MKRREFITLLGGVAAWPCAARAQQASKLPAIGYLGDDALSWSPWTARFVERLRELGWSDGQNISIEYRWSEGRPERIGEIAAEFVQQNVNLIVTYGGAVTGLRQATAVIPIVFAIAVDPVGSGIIASLSHPGGNVTGLSVEQSDIAGKRLELLREIVPGLRRLAIMFDGAYSAAVRENNETQAAARVLGLDVMPHAIIRFRG
jgi:putative tryptophan/tyrosine transport system substrate-binding protein